MYKMKPIETTKWGRRLGLTNGDIAVFWNDIDETRAEIRAYPIDNLLDCEPMPIFNSHYVADQRIIEDTITRLQHAYDDLGRAFADASRELADCDALAHLYYAAERGPSSRGYV